MKRTDGNTKFFFEHGSLGSTRIIMSRRNRRNRRNKILEDDELIFYMRHSENSF